MQLTFLGTTCMVPTKERNHIASFLSFSNEGILMDCGEGTQRQLKIAGIKFSGITKILISHWHGDHVLGLPGLVQSMGASDYQGTLEIYGPKGTEKTIKEMLKVFIFDLNINLKVKDITEKRFFENNEFYIEALELQHRAPCYGFSIIEKDKRKMNIAKIKKLGIPPGPLIGKLQKGEIISIKGKKVLPDDVSSIINGRKISFIADTVLCENCYKLAKDSDLLVCEAAYSSKLEEKANEYMHLTAKQAGLIASASNVKKLILTHFSARYKDTVEIEEDVKEVFPNAICAYDFLKVKI